MLDAVPTETAFLRGMTDPAFPTTNHADTGLVALERELDTLLVEYAILSEAWPRAPGAVNRANIGRRRSFLSAPALPGPPIIIRSPIKARSFFHMAAICSRISIKPGIPIRLNFGK